MALRSASMIPPKNTAAVRFSNGKNGSNDLKNNDINFTYEKKTTAQKKSKFLGTLMSSLRCSKKSRAARVDDLLALKKREIELTLSATNTRGENLE